MRTLLILSLLIIAGLFVIASLGGGGMPKDGWRDKMNEIAVKLMWDQCKKEERELGKDFMRCLNEKGAVYKNGAVAGKW